VAPNWREPHASHGGFSHHWSFSASAKPESSRFHGGEENPCTLTA